MALVLGVGAGLFSVIFIAVLGLFACAVFSRSVGALKNAALGVGVLVVVIALVLFFYPRRTLEEEQIQQDIVNKVVDELIIPKIILFSLMVVLLWFLLSSCFSFIGWNLFILQLYRLENPTLFNRLGQTG